LMLMVMLGRIKLTPLLVRTGSPVRIWLWALR